MISFDKYKVILFDWDNTLVNTWPIIHGALKKTFIDMNIKPWSIEEVRQKVARSMRESFPEIFPNDYKKAGELYQSYYRSIHLDKLEPLKGAVRSLEILSSQDGIMLGIVSNKSRKNLHNEINHLGWEDYFDVIIGSGDAEKDKPSSDPVLLALKILSKDNNGVDIDEVLFIGDSRIDLECAINCDINSVLFGEFSDDEKARFDNIKFDYRASNHDILQKLFVG